MKNVESILVALYDNSMEVAEAFDMQMVTRTQLYAWQPQDGGLALTKIQLTSFPIFPCMMYVKKKNSDEVNGVMISHIHIMFERLKTIS